MIRRPPRSTRTDTLFPYTTLFRSAVKRLGGALARRIAGEAPILKQPGDGLGTLQAEDEAGKLDTCRGWCRTSRADEAAPRGLQCETEPPGRSGDRPRPYAATTLQIRRCTCRQRVHTDLHLTLVSSLCKNKTKH